MSVTLEPPLPDDVAPADVEPEAPGLALPAAFATAEPFLGSDEQAALDRESDPMSKANARRFRIDGLSW
jgi:hypothetical protein